MSLLSHVRSMLASPEAIHEQATASVMAQLQHEAATPRTFQLSRGPLDLFAWPDESTLDDWGKLHTRKMRNSINERYTRYRSFDICDVRRYLEDMRIPVTSQTHRSLEALRAVHCVDFDLVPPSIFERIPHWFNHVISCGQICHPLIASAELGNVIDA